jgi:transcription-repair coupling factor (superfamily II helicase)
MQRYTELGSGFHVASHDLEIRGAGDLLGNAQSGHLHAVGVDLYFELLEESLAALKGEKKPARVEPEINMRISAVFPEDYLPDISERIQLYRRLSSAWSEEEIGYLEVEIRDRFGPLPSDVVNLLGLMRLKLYLQKLCVVRMSSGPKKTSLQFDKSTPIDMNKLVKHIQWLKEEGPRRINILCYLLSQQSRRPRGEASSRQVRGMHSGGSLPTLARCIPKANRACAACSAERCAV